MRTRRLVTPALAVALLLALSVLTLAACGSDDDATTDTSTTKLTAVAYTSVLANIAQNVAGDRVDVTSLIPLGTDPHSFEPTPSDLREVADADLLIINGGGLEGTLLETLENAGETTTIVNASAGITSRTSKSGEPALEEGGTDPHFWLDPVLVKDYFVPNIVNALSKADPEGAATYEANATAYQKELANLNTWIEDQVAQIPAANRKLVMNHASHGYYADRYGFKVVGTVLPSVTTGETPTARQLAELTQTIREHGVRAIFVSVEENPDLATQIADETGVKVVTTLLAPSLTDADGVAPTYIDLMKYDTTEIVNALK